MRNKIIRISIIILTIALMSGCGTKGPSGSGNGLKIYAGPRVLVVAEDVDVAIDAAAAAGVKLMVGFMRRFDTAYLVAKEQIDAGVIGIPVMIKLVGRDPWRTSLEYARRENSGGLIADMAIHDFDAARWLMGSEVVRTYSEGECLVFPELREVGDIDNAVVNLKFENGAVGNVDVSRNAIYGYDIRTEVIGSEGSVFIGGLQGTMVWTMQKNQAHSPLPGAIELPFQPDDALLSRPGGVGPVHYHECNIADNKGKFRRPHAILITETPSFHVLVVPRNPQ